MQEVIMRRPLLLLGIGVVLTVIAVIPVEAATFTVDADNGNPDDNPGDGICATSGDQCTLAD